MTCLNRLTVQQTLTVLFALLICVVLGGQAIAQSSYEKTLTDRGVSPDADGINEYLRQLHPSPELRAKALELIEQLGENNFALREEAMQKLLIMPVLDTEAISAATESNDPEVRWRAEKVLSVGRPETERMLYATFQVIKEKKLSATIPVVIDAIPLCDKKHIRLAAQAALVAAAGEGDAEVLRAALNSESDEVRTAAATALGQAIGKEADADLRALLNDEQDIVQMAAARAMANYGQRDSLATIVKLLQSEDVEVRTLASATLRSLTDKFFGYAAYDKADNRHKAVDAWEKWLAADGQTAELKVPLKPRG